MTRYETVSEAGSRTGVVLAGGRSVRFGEDDKALARFEGETLLARVVDRVGAVTDGVLVSCRAAQRRPFLRVLSDRPTGVCTVADPVDDGGPVVGLAAALRCCRAPTVVVVACDNPLASPAFLDALCAGLAGHDGVVPYVGGTLRPLQAAFKREALESACLDSLADGERSVHEVLARLDLLVVRPSALPVDVADRSFTDVNTRETLGALVRGKRSAR